MNRREFLGVCALGAAGAVFAQETVTGDGLEALRLEFDVPGVSYAVMRGGVIVESQAQGIASRDSGVSVTDQSVFEAASLTKPLFAQVALSLAQEGLLLLDKPLVEYKANPRGARKEEFFKQITPRHVLSHSTGMLNWQYNDRPISNRFEPGTEFGYSGMAFVMLQEIVEEITGESFEDRVQRMAFEPLDMESASVVWREDYAERLVHGHTTNGKVVLHQQPEGNAASSLVCTPGDYLKFVDALVNPPIDYPLALKDEALDAMLKPTTPATDGIAWGLGWGIQWTEPTHTYWHWGNNGNAYHSFVVWNRVTRDGVIVMCNSGHGLKLCRALVPQLMPGDYPAFRWNMVVGQD